MWSVAGGSTGNGGREADPVEETGERERESEEWIDVSEADHA